MHAKPSQFSVGYLPGMGRMQLAAVSTMEDSDMAGTAAVAAAKEEAKEEALEGRYMEGKGFRL